MTETNRRGRWSIHHSALGRENRENERCVSGGVKVMWTRATSRAPSESAVVPQNFIPVRGAVGEAKRDDATRRDTQELPLVKLGEGKRCPRKPREYHRGYMARGRAQPGGAVTTKHDESRKWVGRGVALNFLTSAIRDSAHRRATTHRSRERSVP